MKKYSVLAAFAVALFSSSALAQHFQFAGFQDVETAFENQQAEMAQLKAQLAAFQEAVADPTQAPIASGGDCCVSCCCPTWVGSADIVFLTGKHTDDDVADRFDTEVGYRIALARDNCGSGYRVRYFDWDTNEGAGAGLDALEVTTLDLEWYTECEICCGTSLEISGGVRYLRYVEDFDVIATAPGEYLRLEGWGPVVSIEGTHCVNDCIALFGLVRQSVLCAGGNAFAGDVDNQITLYTEVQTGVEYSRCNWFARAALEGHVVNDIGEADGWGAGLFGGNVSFGFVR